jgi:5-methylcytosine-specific restriction endonuclease McrA
VAAASLWKRENQEKNNQNSRNWTSANPEKKRESSRRYMMKLGREAKRLKLNAWRAKNPEANRAGIAKRRKLIADSPDHYTGDDVREVMRLQRYSCASCATSVREKYHVDHHIPIKLGGDNSRSNIQILCPTCNLTKNAKHPVDFMQSRGFLC